MRAGFDDFECLTRLRYPARFWDRDGQTPRQILTGQRFFVTEDLVIWTGKDDLAALLTCLWPQIKNIIGFFNDLWVMLNYNHRITVITQVLQDAHQAVAITRMQAN